MPCRLRYGFVLCCVCSVSDHGTAKQLAEALRLNMADLEGPFGILLFLHSVVLTKVGVLPSLLTPCVHELFWVLTSYEYIAFEKHILS